MDDKRLRIAIDNSAEQGIISANLLFCCIAVLNSKINNSKKEEHIYKRNRQTLARIALDELGIDKLTLANAITKLSEGCYPTIKAVERVLTMISKGNYTIDNGFIPNKLMKYKSDEELAPITELKPVVPKEKRYAIADKTFVEICAFLETEFNLEMTDVLQRELVKVSGEYDFSSVLKTFQWEKRSIHDSLYGKGIDTNYKKGKYIFGCLNNLLPETDKEIKERERKNKAAMEEAERRMAECHQLTSFNAEYVRKTKTLTEAQKKLIDELW